MRVIQPFNSAVRRFVRSIFLSALRPGSQVYTSGVYMCANARVFDEARRSLDIRDA
jgi:hypothetical protein